MCVCVLYGFAVHMCVCFPLHLSDGVWYRVTIGAEDRAQLRAVISPELRNRQALLVAAAATSTPHASPTASSAASTLPLDFRRTRVPPMFDTDLHMAAVAAADDDDDHETENIAIGNGSRSIQVSCASAEFPRQRWVSCRFSVS